MAKQDLFSRDEMQEYTTSKRGLSTDDIIRKIFRCLSSEPMSLAQLSRETGLAQATLKLWLPRLVKIQLSPQVRFHTKGGAIGYNRPSYTIFLLEDKK